MHPVHETVSEIQWNPATGRVEVALRMSVLDEEWILRNHGDKQQDVKVWGIHYLTQTFRVGSKAESVAGKAAAKKDVKPDRYHWVGRKDEGAHVWWFFEIEPTAKQKPATVSQRMFFSRHDGYANRVLILGDPPAAIDDALDDAAPAKDATVPRRSVTLTIQRPTTNLDVIADDERSQQP